MSFEEIVNTDSGIDHESDFKAQVEKHKEYVKRYQAKMRAKAKLMTIEKYINSNPGHAVAYIKKHFPHLLK